MLIHTRRLAYWMMNKRRQDILFRDDRRVRSSKDRFSYHDRRRINELVELAKEEDWQLALEYYQPLSHSSRTLPVAERIWAAFEGPHLEFCDYCDEWQLHDDMDWHYDQRMCSSCAEQRIYTEDGEFMLEDDAHQHRNGLWYSYAQRRLADYHQNARREDVICRINPDCEDKLRKEKLFFGIEWEYNSEDRDADADRIEELEFALSERDGSLDDRRGIEIVTGYSTLGTVCRWVDIIEENIRINHLNGAGLHVNLSGLDSRATAKLISLFNSSPRQMKRVAGRYNTEYAEEQESALGHWLERFRSEKRHEVTGSKYVHVRVRGYYTELRIFDSSDSSAVVKGRIQFVWLCAHFCAQPGLDVSFDRLVQWFGENPWTHQHVPDLIKMDCGFRRSGQHKVPPKGPKQCPKPTSQPSCSSA